LFLCDLTSGAGDVRTMAKPACTTKKLNRDHMED
jgi:hypothetical protein